MKFLTTAAAALLGIFAAAAAAAEPMVFRITLNTGPNHVRNIMLENFVDKLSERTEGQLDVQVFPSGQLYKGPDVPKALAQGSVEMGVPIILYISRIIPNAGIGDLPMFFGRPVDEIHAIFDGPLGAELNQEIEDKLGVKIFGRYLDLGHGTIFTSNAPLTGLASLNGLKLRVPGSAAARVRYDSLGVTAQSISFADVPIHLQQGTIDGLMTTHETIRSAKLWEAGLKYAMDTRGVFFQYVPMIGQPTWDKLGPDLQATITDVWEETIDGARELAAARQMSARDEGIANGIQVIEADAAELASFRAELIGQQDDLIEEMRIDAGFAARVAAELDN